MIQSSPNCCAAAAGRTPAQQATMVLTVLGLCASFGTILSYIPASRAQIGPNPYFYGNVIKDTVYYTLHGAEILLMVSAGLLALWSIKAWQITGGYLWRFLLFLAAGGLMAARGYTLQNLLSTRLVDATGPFMCLISLVIFIGVHRSNWVVIDKVMRTTAFVLSAATIYEIAGLRTAARVEAVRSTLPILYALFWPTAWTALREYPKTSAARYVRFVPAVVYALGSLFAALRLNFVMLFFLLGMCCYVDLRRRELQAKRWLVASGLMLWLVLFSIVFLSDTTVFKRLQTASEGLYARLGEDTRTGQLTAFFESVQPRELLLGRGSFATWWWNGEDWNGGTDYGYLNLLLYGGVPLLVTYFAVHLAPSLALLRRGPKGVQFTACLVVLLWTIRMFSTAEPSLALDYYPVLLCVGMSISRETALSEQRAINVCLKSGWTSLQYHGVRAFADRK